MHRFLLIIALFAVLTGQEAFSQETSVTRSTVIENFKGKPYYLHFVKQGETLFGISKAYNVSVQEIEADNPEIEKGMKMDQVLRIPVVDENLKPVEKVKVTTTLQKPDTITKPAVKQQYLDYIVNKKETLYGISKKFGVTVDDLIRANPSMTELKNGMVIRVPLVTNQEEKTSDVTPKPTTNSKLPVPEDGLLVVKQGQTLYSISKQYEISEETLLQLNPELSEGLKTGQTIRLKESAAKPQTEVEKEISQVKTLPVKPVNTEVFTENCTGISDESKVYEVALLMPLNLEMADSIISTSVDNMPPLKNFKTYDLFQYYLGSMMALDTLEKSGCRVNFHVYDADAENDTLKIRKVLKKSEMQQMDLIIAPLFARSFNIAARFAQQHQIPVINPLSRRNTITEGNPEVYKAYPSDEAIAAELATYISGKFPDANIISVRNSLKESNMMSQVFSDSLRKSVGGSHLQEVIYQDEGFAGVSKRIDNQKKNIVLLFSSSRSLVPAFVSKLNAYAKSSDIVLFGIPGWEDMEIETEFLLNLKYHQAVPSFINYEGDATRRFVAMYREKYGAQPLAEREAFLGYDVTCYFLSALMHFGNHFEDCIPGYVKPGLQYNFRFRQADANDGFGNTDARILHYDNFRWVEAL
ncbi:MAG TPA: LysM peptidoglycan-binding domain-containing protein [Bacteroidales bacterium]|jgi:LysM repeat protein/ABC-type branched-subunit amino acid transport system substrate-binding protein|nr:LysM peptidoglycan-binding domain-containing protein [Bacteroidales bacterium]